MASEVDKRRKSAENSPVQQQGQHSSPRKSGASDLRLADASFDPNSLAAKFKAGLMQGGPSQVNKLLIRHMRNSVSFLVPPSSRNTSESFELLGEKF